MSRQLAVVFVGDTGVGKTTLLRAVAGEKVPKSMEPSTDISHIEIGIQNVQFSFYDVPACVVSTEKAQAIINEASAAFLCYDITDRQSFESATTVYKRLVRAEVVFLLGLKSDLISGAQVSEREMEQFAASNAIFFLGVSAFKGRNVRLMMRLLRIHLASVLQQESLEPKVPMPSSEVLSCSMGSELSDTSEMPTRSPAVAEVSEPEAKLPMSSRLSAMRRRYAELQELKGMLQSSSPIQRLPDHTEPLEPVQRTPDITDVVLSPSADRTRIVASVVSKRLSPLKLSHDDSPVASIPVEIRLPGQRMATVLVRDGDSAVDIARLVIQTYHLDRRTESRIATLVQDGVLGSGIRCAESVPDHDQFESTVASMPDLATARRAEETALKQAIPSRKLQIYVSRGKKGSITVRPGDDASEKAQSFSLAYQLSAAQQAALQSNLESVLDELNSEARDLTLFSLDVTIRPGVVRSMRVYRGVDPSVLVSSFQRAHSISDSAARRLLKVLRSELERRGSS